MENKTYYVDKISYIRSNNDFEQLNSNIESNTNIDNKFNITSGYTAPCDGYLTIVIPYSSNYANKQFMVYLDGITVAVFKVDPGSTLRHCVFIKKGITITFEDNTGLNVSLEFISTKRV